MVVAQMVMIVADALAETRGGTRMEHIKNAELFVAMFREISQLPGGDAGQAWSYLLPRNPAFFERCAKNEPPLTS